MDAAGDQHPWSLERTTAELHGGRLTGTVDVAQPDVGLRRIQLSDQSFAAHLLCVSRDDERPSWQLPVADAYVRGSDLVASYKPTDDWPYSPQIYWRAESLVEVDGALAALSLILSVQTHLLDTWPGITVSSQIGCDEVLHVKPDSAAVEVLNGDRAVHSGSAPCCVLRRLSNVPISYVEIMPPGDFRKLAIRRDEQGTCQFEWQLFADFLEKGVIRRARMLAAFVARVNDVELALACCHAIGRRPLPLTA